MSDVDDDEWRSALFAGGVGRADALSDVDDASDFRECLRAFAPTEHPPLLEWCVENIVTDQGRPYDHGAYPHLGAPGGPCDVFDDPVVRTITLQWASRLGKSFFGQCVTLYVADADPAPQMFASSKEKLAKEVVGRTYTMARARPKLDALFVKALREQKQDLMEFRRCKVYVAWARSASTLADKNIKCGHANELDDWDHLSTAKDGDPQEQFNDRFKDYQSIRKVIYESIPKVKGKSRIEPLRAAGTDCRLWVPCPHCKKFSVLAFRQLKWDSPADGSKDPSLAFQTARYECPHCAKSIEDHHRPWMIRRGLWAPRDSTLDHKKALEIAEASLDVKTRPTWRGWKAAKWVKSLGRDLTDASYQLSSLYALSLRWGDIAKKFVTVCRKPQLLRNFINQWLGETWEPRKSKSTADEIAKRLTGPTQRGTVPLGGVFLTCTIDRQGAEGGYAKYTVLAHGEHERAWLVDYGVRGTLDQIWAEVIRNWFPHADRGESLYARWNAVDSGWNTKETYAFCQTHPGMWPCKGANHDLGGAEYQLATLGRGTRTQAEGQVLLHVATDLWESELQARIDDREPGGPGSIVLCPEAAADTAFMEEFLNARLEDSVDPRGNARLVWVKRDPNAPNDFRDCVRYGLCLGKFIVDQAGGVLPPRGKPRKSRSAVLNAGEGRPDGRSWLER